MSWNVLIVLGCLVGGYVVVSMLMNIRPDDLRPPPERDDSPPTGPSAPSTPSLPSTPPAAANAARLPPPRQGDWTMLLDVPRSASARDIEAAFRRQQARAAAAGDQRLLENLRRAREAALAEKKQG